MKIGSKSTVVALVVASGVLTGITAPAAHANGADAVIRDLEAEGYTVRLNWLNGNKPTLLPRCTVVRVNNPSSDEPAEGDVVWADVACPNNTS
ncbi:hypothetical protein [Mycolicibacterium llatzerense]|jgi:hypothetical protein|uniref:PASTA domain-containing protein n=1 Tax=Mycolicibacterium llatzerense TaxID=280871 RepID=A0A0D1J913_9MYCO|nr:hypothetical protein [Mycolicibacterium llatzerense]KIU18088.1 hypothetical protein TL10_05465 [Mycolicibacterium llatzerense]